MRTIFYAGNDLVDQDSIAVKVARHLTKEMPEVTFIHFDPTEELPQISGGLFILIDTVVGLNGVRLFENLADFTHAPRFSVHDYDLSIDLPLLQKLGKLPKISIIGIGSTMHLKEAVRQTKELLTTIGL